MLSMASQREQYLRKQQMTLAKLMFVAGALLLIGSGYFWLEKVHGNSNNVFWGMVDNNLKNFGQTQKSAQQDPQRNLSQEQSVQLQLGSQAVAAGETKILQNANTPEQVNVDTQTIGTPSTNYVRYTNLVISQPLPDGKKPDFSNLENVWAQEPNTDGSKSALIQAMFGSLGRMPVGYLQQSQRQELVSTMQDNSVYKINPKTVKKEYRGIRPVYTYDIDVNVQQYVFMLKKFDSMSGLNQITAVDPTQFPADEKVRLQVVVDIISRNLLSVTYMANKQTENFSGFGAYAPIKLPAQAVSVEELERQLQATLLGQ